ncbi:RelA/SpoT family protein [Peptoanaerobacter stomatis]|uniref:GTP diphosphokinase n=1 Tax=Peptoanaerobacter stomatis TaxID=796937 RepID=V9HTY2_9FIRM|nr:RelA/SpoT family protein [Peptoanaerobacter stomatis]
MLENVIKTVQQYNPDADVDILIKAYEYAENKHEGQVRRSGEAYIVHPVQVAGILAELELDVATIAAGLMHDVVEDTDTTNEQMINMFGVEIATLVDGVTKLGKIDYKSKEENQTENLRKMFMAMAKDVRVVLIKLADRLHNMRTLKFMPPRKAREKSKETIEIFAPIAGRLGISKIKWEMEDIALRYLEPEFYFDMERKISRRITQRDSYINGIISKLKEKIQVEANIPCEIYGREKNMYSIYKKMKFKNKSFEEIYDFIAVRVVVKELKDCYGVIGIVHTIWKPIPTRFKDYIAMPKVNMYQSIHTTIFGPDGEPVEIQIRTEEMHKTAEYGIAAHWKYKEGRIDTNESDMDKKLAWLRQIMDWQKEVSDPTEFMESLKIDLFANQVFVFTPKGDVIELPTDSTPIDLAYKIHTNVGNTCIGAKISGKIVPLDTKLKNGQIVEIMTSASSKGPSRDWINIVKSSHAKNKIRQWFKKERKEENIEKGKELIEKETKKQGYPLGDFLRTKALVAAAKFLSQASEEELYAALGYGGLTMNQVMGKLKDIYEKDFGDKIKEEKLKQLKENQRISQEGREQKKERKNRQLVNVTGVDNILTRLAKCCTPIPGDEIVGYITKGRGVTVHRKDCPNAQRDMQNSSKELVEVHWNDINVNSSFDVEVQIRGYDRRGLFGDISRIFEDEKSDLLSLNARRVKDDIAIIDATFEVRSKEQVRKIIRKLKAVPDIHDVFRISK